MTPAWLKFLPATLRTRIEHRPNLQKALTNTAWLFGDKILRMGVGLFVGVWVARYLGPEQFGLMNYAMAIVALFGAIGSLGLNGIVVRDLVREEETANVTLGTAFLLQAIGGLIAFALSVIAISYARSDNNLAKLMVVVLGFVTVFKSTEVVKYWFESQVKSKYVVWVENGVFVILAIVKVGLILAQAPLMAFVWAAFAEGALAAVGLLGVYAWRGGVLSAWHIRYGRAKELLKDGWPLILSGLAVMVYMRIDQVMLGQMQGDGAVGIYTAAVRISEVWYFIPMSIIASVFPAIIEAKKQSESLYYQRLQKLYDLMVLIAITVALPMTFLAKWIVVLLFGQDYAQAGSVLSIHIWASVFVFFSSAWAKSVLIEGRQMLFLLFDAFSVSINIILNVALIPAYGPIGAAVATSLSVPITYVLLFLMKKDQGLLKMLLYSFFKNSYVWNKK